MNLKKFVKFASLLLALSAFSNAYAIKVHVKSTSSKITALGFTANGSKHGGLGKSYDGTDMPKGNYVFGVRYKGKDITCLNSDGKKKFKLTKNTNALLKFKGGKCTAAVK
jgi:hypothetical protein